MSGGGHNALEVANLSAGYGESIVLANLSFSLRQGEALALLGRNGAGKTTLINTIVGLTRRREGQIVLGGKNITDLRPDQRARAGVGWTPQERNIFRSLTVEENLTAVQRPGKFTLKRIYEIFPRLAERRENMGDQLSGGEQQMLAISRALVLNPSLLLLDEPLEGLAPIIVDELLATLAKIIREENLAVILVEQSAAKILPLTYQAIILERGAIAWRGASDELLRDHDTRATMLGVAEKNKNQNM